MRAVVLSTNVRTAYRLWRAVSATKDLNAVCVIANAQRRPIRVFGARNLVGMILGGPRCWAWAASAGARRLLWITTRSFEDPGLLRRLRALNADVGLHAANVIYRSALIRCFGIGILNAHIGLLPKYRGRSVMEWSILNGDPTGISTFLIDEGIDTGPIVLREEIPVAGAGAIPEAKRRLFSLDGDMYARALALLDEERFVPVRQDARGGTRWYPMSELFRGVVEELLRHGA